MSDSSAKKIDGVVAELLPLELDEKYFRVYATISKAAVDRIQAFPPSLIDDADRHMRRFKIADFITHYELYREQITAVWNALLRVEKDVTVRVLLGAGLPKLTGLRFDTVNPPAGCVGILHLTAAAEAVNTWHPRWIALYCDWLLKSHGQAGEVSETSIESIRIAYIRRWAGSGSFPVRERTAVNPAMRDKDFVLRAIPYTGEVEFVLGRVGVLRTPGFAAKLARQIASAGRLLVERPESNGIVVCGQEQWLPKLKSMVRGTAQLHVDMPQTALAALDRDALGINGSGDDEYRLLALLLLYQNAQKPVALDPAAFASQLTIKIDPAAIADACRLLKARYLSGCFEAQRPGHRYEAYVRSAWSSTAERPLRGFAPTFRWGRMAMEQLPAHDRNIQVVMLNVRESQITEIQARLTAFHRDFVGEPVPDADTTYLLSSQLTPITNIPGDDLVEGRDNEFDDGAMWVTMVLRELATLRDFYLSTEWVRNRLAFPIENTAIERAFDVLKRSGLLKLDPVIGRYVPSVENITTEDEITSEKVFKFHQTMIRFAEDVHRRYPKRLGQLSTTFLSARSGAIEARKPEINKFLDKLMDECQTPRQADHVYQLNLQFYPLARRV